MHWPSAAALDGTGVVVNQRLGCYVLEDKKTTIPCIISPGSEVLGFHQFPFVILDHSSPVTLIANADA
jgi:hypothetical protein